jgi:hypothetical protein
MDTQQILERLKAEPGYEENAKHFREVLDSSEAKDADWLADFVASLALGLDEEQFKVRTSTAVGALKRKRLRNSNQG